MPHLLDCPEIKHVSLFSFCVPHCPYRKSGPEVADKSSACRDAEGKLCAMGPIVAEMQSTDPSGSTFLLTSRGVGRCSCFGRGWYFLLVSEQVKNSVHSNSSLPSNWIQDENIRFASDHIISGKFNSSISQVSDILKKCLYTFKTITGKNLSLTYTEILYLTSYPIAVYFL